MGTVGYSLQLARKMPLVPKMLDELVFALPPLSDGRVCDLAAGNGNAAVKIKVAYPRVAMSVVEKCPYRISQCKTRLASVGMSLSEEHVCEIDLDNFEKLPGIYSLVVA